MTKNVFTLLNILKEGFEDRLGYTKFKQNIKNS